MNLMKKKQFSKEPAADAREMTDRAEENFSAAATLQVPLQLYVHVE
jgi:hypothetical protein